MRFPPRAPRMFVQRSLFLLVLGMGLAFHSGRANETPPELSHNCNDPTALVLKKYEAVSTEGKSTDFRRQRALKIGVLAIFTGNNALLSHAFAEIDALQKAAPCKACAATTIFLRGLEKNTNDESDAAIALFNQAEETLGHDKASDLTLQIHSKRAAALRTNGNYTQSIVDAVAALKIAETRNDPEWVADMLDVLANNNASLGNYAQAESQIDESIQISKKIQCSFQLAYSMLDLGNIKALQNKREQQRVALLDALRLAQARSDLSEVETIALSNLSDYHLSQKEYPQALRFANQAQEKSVAVRDERSESMAIINQGLALIGLGQTDAGIARIKDAIALAKKNNLHEYAITMSQELIAAYENAHRYREANALLHEIANQERQLTDQQRHRDILALQFQYSSERKNREIERLSLENAKQAALASARSSQRQVWLAASIALALALILLAQWLHRLHRKNRNLSNENAHDPLTGAFNRRYLEAQMAKLSANVERKTNTPADTALVLLDLDHFKRINDGYGHDAGDAVLVHFSKTLQSMLRQQDRLIRWGGEEFVLLLTGTTVAGVETLLSRILQTIAQTPVAHAGVAIPVTVSAGATFFPLHPKQHWQEALHLADMALYHAKETGRNRAACLVWIADGCDPQHAGFQLSEALANGTIKLVEIQNCG